MPDPLGQSPSPSMNLVPQSVIVVKENLGYTLDVRARRIRFTKPSVREDHPRAIKTRDGVSMYRRNMEGRHLKAEAIGEQRRKQQSLCIVCGQWLEYADAVFRDKTFREGVENAVIHRKCPIIAG